MIQSIVLTKKIIIFRGYPSYIQKFEYMSSFYSLANWLPYIYVNLNGNPTRLFTYFVCMTSNPYRYSVI